MSSPKTLYQKHIDAHTVCALDDQSHVLLYIDRQVINEYTSPQAFSGLCEVGRSVWRPGTALAVPLIKGSKQSKSAEATFP